MRKATRNSNADPVLAGLANRLNGDILFADLTDPPETDNGNWPGVSFCHVRKLYRVRVCLGGVNRVLGVSPSAAVACRFADACREFFWPHKIRAGRKPADADFIYDRATTESDLKNNPSLASTLQAILTHLQSTGGVPVVEEGKARAKEARQTARTELRDYLADRADAEDQLRKEMKQSFKEILELLRTLDKRVDELAHQAKWGQPTNQTPTLPPHWHWVNPPPAPAWEQPPLSGTTLWCGSAPPPSLPPSAWYANTPPPAPAGNQPWYNPETGELKVQRADGVWVLQDPVVARACPGGVSSAGYPLCGKTPCECCEPVTNASGACTVCNTLPCECGPSPSGNTNLVGRCKTCDTVPCQCPPRNFCGCKPYEYCGQCNPELFNK